MTRAAPYGSAAWRAWKHDHHWNVTANDPLGAGNTVLIASLGVTPLAFYDVRKNLTLSGSNVTSLKDVKGDGTYGPSFGTAGTAPTWDGITINTNGTGILLTSAVVPGLDLSTALTVAVIADVPTVNGARGAVIGAASNGAPNWSLPLSQTATTWRTQSDKNATGATSIATTGTGNIRLALYTVNVATGSQTPTLTVEVPNTAQVSNTVNGSGAEASGNQFIAIGGTTSHTALLSVRFRALLAWAGGYTAGQKSTLLTYAQTYHSAVAA